VTDDRAARADVIEEFRAIVAMIDARRAREASQKKTVRGRIGRWLLASEQRSRERRTAEGPWPFEKARRRR
jgi:hypothetical protein